MMFEEWRDVDSAFEESCEFGTHDSSVVDLVMDMMYETCCESSDKNIWYNAEESHGVRRFGLLHGHWRSTSIDDNGRPICTTLLANYDQGKLVGVDYVFDGDGQLHSMYDYDDNVAVCFFIDGTAQIKYMRQFHILDCGSIVSHGSCVEYHKNGQIKVHATCNMGKMIGLADVYNEQGVFVTQKSMTEDRSSEFTYWRSKILKPLNLEYIHCSMFR